ncbi:metallophosphoesterase [Paenibacillus sp. P96]|uniref:Metallophosphoesterase n=1 Tax=Paenibacillus zeirhizosphaerae TaxID=2987519 RepID=A0ABT9FUQ1_9BACL|nr:metallophosphoesterase [Paenibacillus sp. P96]MDP4098459.1 metallophosphoesterase [Paenibacillus sp. P96]
MGKSQHNHRPALNDGEDTVLSSRDYGGTASNRGQVQQMRISRRSFLKKATAAAVGTAAVAGGYAAVWEPGNLEITQFTLRLPKLPASFNDMRVLHFSDMHLGFFKNEDDMRRLATIIGGLRPDMICFTGDIVDDYADSMTGSVPILKSMSAPLGKFAILGNHDYRGIPEGVEALYKKTGFTLLKNEHYVIHKDGESMAVVGLEDLLLSTPDPEAALQGLPYAMFKLLLMHEPDYADTAVRYGFDMQLSGHSHGGQVRVPLLGAVLTPPGGRKYVQGLYRVGADAMPLYVSRGVGMTHLPIRVLCRPEISLITLRTAL